MGHPVIQKAANWPFFRQQGVTAVTHHRARARNSQASINFRRFPACATSKSRVNVLSTIRRCPMDEVKDATLSAEIERLQTEHRRYAQRLEELLQKPYLSEDEQLEEIRLKKLKLHAKDLIHALERRALAVA
jgi:hypothetical protein